MAFEIRERARGCRPAGCQARVKRRQQHVVDLGVVGAGTSLQQRLRLVRGERDGASCRRRLRSSSASAAAQRCGASRRLHRRDVPSSTAARVAATPSSRSCRRRSAHALNDVVLGGSWTAARPSAVRRRFRVFEQRTPRDAVDRQVMDHDQQPARLRRAEVEVRRAPERAVLEIEARLRVCGSRSRRSTRAARSRVERRRGRSSASGVRLRDVDVALSPAAALADVTQAQRVVVPTTAARARFEQRRDRAARDRLEQESLVVVMRLGEVLLEEPVAGSASAARRRRRSPAAGASTVADAVPTRGQLARSSGARRAAWASAAARRAAPAR